jgi:fermentation-respiration switch protein FrsA (DUF1100 family)
MSEVSESASLVGMLQDWVIFGSKLGAGFAVLMLGVLWYNQDKMLYHPNPPGAPKLPSENPKGCRLPSEFTRAGDFAHPSISLDLRIPFEEVFITTADKARIHTWLLLQENAKTKPTLIFSHGNAGNMGFRLPHAALFYAKSGVNVVMYDYRGFGASEGTPSEKGLNLDAIAVLEFVSKHPALEGSPILLFGESLGGAVTISLAHARPTLVSGIILENTFLSVPKMVDHLMPLVAPLKGLILSIKWDSDMKITTLPHPMLFVSGLADQLVPPFHMKALHDSAAKSSYRDLYEVPGGEHNDTFVTGGMTYYRRVRDFAARVLGTNTSGAGAGAGGVTSVSVGDDGGIAFDQSVFHTPTMGTDFRVK